MHSKRVYRLSALCVLLGACGDVDGQPGDEEDVSEASQGIEQQNLAADKPTAQSSTMHPFSAARAVDGNTDGHFPNGSVTHTGIDPQGWWQVDLGAVIDIGKVIIYNRTDCCGDRLANFDILLSNDGSNWQVATSFAGIAPAKTELSIVGSGRFVRVRLQGTEYLSLAEVQVFAASPPAPWTPCAQGGATCSFSGAKAVRYGVNGSYVTKIALNSITCDDATFGDPAPFQQKSCSYTDVLWSKCAMENGTCTIPANSIVRYGANGAYVTTVASNSIACNNATFGDPIYGTVKHCDVASVNSSNLLINVDTAGCQTNMAINNAIGQSFQVSSPTTLDHFGIWIKPELYYVTSYNVELYDGEGTGGAKLATSNTVTMSSQTSGAPSTWYDFAFAQGVSLQANHAYTLKLVRLSQYSGAFSECGNVYPGGIEYWLGYWTEPGHDMSFRLYGQ
jgi:hypothetical protein